MPLHSVPRSFGPPKEKGRPVNWRRGLFRIWLLISAAWIMAWIIYLLMQGIHGEFRTIGDLLEVPILLLGPPIALLLFGIAAGWTFRGFKTDEDPSGG